MMLTVCTLRLQFIEHLMDPEDGCAVFTRVPRPMPPRFRTAVAATVPSASPASRAARVDSETSPSSLLATHHHTQHGHARPRGLSAELAAIAARISAQAGASFLSLA